MKKKDKKKKILVAMSGGVDSSVAVALLAREGHEVVGAFMVNYEDPCSAKSCWRGDYQDALRVSAKLGIKLLRLDFVKGYDKMVLSYIYKEYEAGRTPNPDVLCNKFIKFGFWLDKARELGFDYLATGHYAQIKRNAKSGENHMFVSRDHDKDQTYFLHQLTQDQLKYTLFPIGGYTKNKVRKLAEKFSLPTATKEESMGICFIGEVPMKEFLEKRIKSKLGKIILSEYRCHSREGDHPLTCHPRAGGDPSLHCHSRESGNPDDLVVGEHDGLAFYTIGERIGIKPINQNLKFLNKKPIFVLDKNIKNNELIVGFEDNPLLFKKEIGVAEVNWVAGHEPKMPLKCLVRLRHRQPLQKCVVYHGSQKTLRAENLIVFDKPQRAITPGQFAVFYKKNECLGGGAII